MSEGTNEALESPRQEETFPALTPQVETPRHLGKFINRTIMARPVFLPTLPQADAI